MVENEEINVTVDDFSLESTMMRRITVAYTWRLTPPVSHVFEFFTDTIDDYGRGIWDEFIDAITGSSEWNSLVSHARRDGDVMFEFQRICKQNKYHAAVA
jgi:hypothetical protein